MVGVVVVVLLCCVVGVGICIWKKNQQNAVAGSTELADAEKANEDNTTTQVVNPIEANATEVSAAAPTEQVMAPPTQ